MSLPLNERKDGAGDGLVHRPEQVVPPHDEGELVHLVDELPIFFALPLDPVTVQVAADPVEHLGGELELLPLLRVEPEDVFVHLVLSFLKRIRENE